MPEYGLIWTTGLTEASRVSSSLLLNEIIK